LRIDGASGKKQKIENDFLQALIIDTKVRFSSK